MLEFDSNSNGEEPIRAGGRRRIDKKGKQVEEHDHGVFPIAFLKLPC